MNALLVTVTAVAMTRADAWTSRLLGIPAGTLTFAAIVAGFALFVRFDRRPLRAPDGAWWTLLAFYASCFGVGVLFGDTTWAGEWARDNAYFFAVFAVLFHLASTPRAVERLAGTIAACGALVAAVNVAEFLVPSVVHLSHTAGRAAGLLRNANASACAVTLSWTAFVLHARWRPPRRFVALAAPALYLAGVAVTLSRGGFLLAALAVGATTAFARPSRALRAGVALAVAAVVAFGSITVHRVLSAGRTPTVQAVEKMAVFASGRIDDNYRLALARYYARRGAERPWTGWGFEATIRPSPANTDLYTFFGVKGPHNTPVAILAEFGVLPAVLWLAFLALAWARCARIADAGARRTVRVMILVALAQNAFAHDLPVWRPLAAVYALVAVVTARPMGAQPNGAPADTVGAAAPPGDAATPQPQETAT